MGLSLKRMAMEFTLKTKINTAAQGNLHGLVKQQGTQKNDGWNGFNFR